MNDSATLKRSDSAIWNNFGYVVVDKVKVRMKGMRSRMKEQG
jgi:hypothetical protein